MVDYVIDYPSQHRSSISESLTGGRPWTLDLVEVDIRQRSKREYLAIYFTIFALNSGYLCHRRWTEFRFSPRFVSLPVSRISPKVKDGCGQNLVDRLGVYQGRICWILVKIRIRIQIWIRQYLNFRSDSSPLRDRAKNDI